MVYINTYITKGVKNNIPEDIINFIFRVVDNIPKYNLDYLQIFRIQMTQKQGVLIEHKQEQPEFEKVYFLLNDEIEFEGKLYLIIENEYMILILAEEY
ncbi:DUF960 family protein [Clostridium sp.]|uniref:DUF960 family protein n=1 Tax=Clostridium sp. TaxID=1506 RepID=UPI002FCB17AD